MLSEKEFKNLAALARLDPEDDNLRGLMADFNKIIDYVEKIKTMDLDHSKEYYTVLTERNVVRDDETVKTLDTLSISGMAPSWESGYFVVPKVIETE